MLCRRKGTAHPKSCMLSHWKRGAAPDTRPSPLSPPPPIIQQYAGTYRTLRQARLRSRSHSSEPCADSSRNQYPPNKHILTVDGDEKKSYNSFQSYDGSVQGRDSRQIWSTRATHTPAKNSYRPVQHALRIMLGKLAICRVLTETRIEKEGSSCLAVDDPVYWLFSAVEPQPYSSLGIFSLR